MTTLLAVLPLTLLTALPVPGLGFSAEATDGGMRVVSVEDGGVTAGRLAPGMLLTHTAPRLFQTVPGGAVEVLPPDPFVAVMLFIEGQDLPVQAHPRMTSEQEEFPEALTEEEVTALPRYRQIRYWQSRKGKELYRRSGESPAPIRVTLASPTSLVLEKPGSQEVVALTGSDLNGDVLTGEVAVAVDCWSRPIHQVKVTLPGASRPVVLTPKQLGAGPGQVTARWSRRAPLWTLSAASRACADGHLHSPPVEVELTCGNRVYRHTQRALPLAVRCDGDAEAATAPFAQRPTVATPAKLKVGDDGHVVVCVRLGLPAPLPAKVTPVLLDDKGGVAQRFPAVPLLGGEAPDEVEVELTLPTSAPGTLRVAFEADLWKGETALNRPAAVTVQPR